MAVINREALIEEYKLSQRHKEGGDIGFTWVVKAHKISLVNALDMAEQVNQWVDLKNGGVREVRANDYNNKEFVVEGKKWYVLIAQHYTNGEMEDDTNIMCPVSLMLFGTMVSGMTYAFEKKEDRDNFFDAIKSSKRIKITQTKVRKCDLCGGACECEYGHNPYPLLCDNARVCGKCNSKEVIPARMKGVFRTRDLDEDDKKGILADCRKIIKKQQDELREIAWKENVLGFPSADTLNNEPTLKAIFGRLTECMEQIYSISNRMIDEAMIYAGQRLERHIKCRSISSPEDICLTTQGVMAGLALHRDMEEYIHKQAFIVNEFNEEVEAIRQRNATELINSADDIAPPKQEKVKTKAEIKKEQTRNANKAKAEEKKLKEEQDRLSALAYAKSQADKKKKAREIAIKKQKAWLKEGEKFLAELEKLNEEEA